MSRPLVELDIERAALGEADAPSPATVDAARVAALRASNEEILARYPARSVALRVHERLAAQRRRAGALVTAMLAPAAVAALMLVVVRPHEGLVVDEGPDQTVSKGQAPDVQVFAIRGGAPTRVESARAGDRVQLAIVPAGAKHAALVSLDGRGGVTLHFPSSARASTSVDPRATVRLPDSFELDDAPAFERFVLVTAETPIDVDVVLDAARTLAQREGAPRARPLALPPGLSQTSRTIEKTDEGPR